MTENNTETTAVATDKTAVADQETTLPEVTMADLPDSWRDAMQNAGWKDLMPIQAKAMPYLMAGKDLMAQARTGSGKTGAFVLPILERVNRLDATCQALILGPTRELALQVAKEAEMLSSGSGIRVVPVYGGVGYKQQLDALKKGAHIVVGTPGRILDHLQRGTLTFDNLKLMVFDEADRLLDMGFYPDMRQLQSYFPNRKIDGFMFSATFPTNVKRLAQQFLHDPAFLSLSSDNVHVAEIEHAYYMVPPMDKDRALIRIIETENPASAFIFCNTKVKVTYVATVLQRAGYNADGLSGDLSQKDREKIMERVRQGKLSLLVTTDVAARGIDIPALSHVIQYEPPDDMESYIHRAGRTGRAGASGSALTLVGVFTEQAQLKKIQQRYKIEMVKRPSPTEEEVATLVSQRVTAILEARLRQRTALQKERAPRFTELARQLSQSESTLALLAMLLDDTYQDSLHTAVENPELAPPKKQKTSQSSGRKRKPRKRRRR